jgi:hypothetical protein
MRILFHPRLYLYKARVYDAIRSLPEVCIVEEPPCDIAIHWGTGEVFHRGDVLDGLYSEGIRVLNYHLLDTTKYAVDQYHREALGYSSLVPKGYIGKVVVKRNQQARNAAFISDRYYDNYAATDSPNYRVSQKFINTEHTPGWCTEHRAAIFSREILLIEKKKRSRYRFNSFAEQYRIVDMEDVFSLPEIDQIFKFCCVSGLDFGELDILRDKDDGRIYIVDINNKAGRAGKLAKDKIFIKEYVEHFKRMVYG